MCVQKDRMMHMLNLKQLMYVCKKNYAKLSLLLSQVQKAYISSHANCNDMLGVLHEYSSCEGKIS